VALARGGKLAKIGKIHVKIQIVSYVFATKQIPKTKGSKYDYHPRH